MESLLWKPAQQRLFKEPKRENQNSCYSSVAVKQIDTTIRRQVCIKRSQSTTIGRLNATSQIGLQLDTLGP
jgi:hypothetical protein